MNLKKQKTLMRTKLRGLQKRFDQKMKYDAQNEQNLKQRT